MQSIFGEKCPACCGPTIGGLCTHCRATLRRIDDPCHRCGLPQPVANCPRRRQRWSIAAVTAPFAYEEPLAHYIRRLKYSGSRSLGRAFGLMLAADLETAARSIDAIVAVPLHPRRLRERGFNQAVEIARTIAAVIDRPWFGAGIHRRLAGPAQTGLGLVSRHAHVAAAFAVTRDLRGARIAIVDDVLTTGATANALGDALLAAGAVHCEAWAVARTPDRTRYTQPRNR